MAMNDAALDRLYDLLDDMLASGRFSEVDDMLNSLQPENLTVAEMLAVLTVTLPARGRLKHRWHFFEAVEDEMLRRKEYEDGLLRGLE